MTYPVSFRRHVLALREKESLTFEQTSTRFGIGIASLVRWSNQIEPKVYVRLKRKLNVEELAEDVRLHPDAYQYERAARFGVSQKAIWSALQRLNVTYKKSPAPSKGGRRQTYELPGDDQRL